MRKIILAISSFLLLTSIPLHSLAGPIAPRYFLKAASHSDPFINKFSDPDSLVELYESAESGPSTATVANRLEDLRILTRATTRGQAFSNERFYSDVRAQLSYQLNFKGAPNSTMKVNFGGELQVGKEGHGYSAAMVQIGNRTDDLSPILFDVAAVLRNSPVEVGQHVLEGWLSSATTTGNGLDVTYCDAGYCVENEFKNNNYLNPRFLSTAELGVFTNIFGGSLALQLDGLGNGIMFVALDVMTIGDIVGRPFSEFINLFAQADPWFAIDPAYLAANPGAHIFSEHGAIFQQPGTVAPQPVPEPSSFALFGIALATLCVLKKKESLDAGIQS